MNSFLDYSRDGQALILQQLLTPLMPSFVVDIGAHDGMMASNSRNLLELGWAGVLVEPIPDLAAHLRVNSRRFGDVVVVEAACSDRDGTTRIRVGRDGRLGENASLSSEPEIAANLSDEAIEVQTLTLPNLFASYGVPEDFGVLLVDTEGWDFAVLRQLDAARHRPRVIVTEQFGPTNQDKYNFLAARGYRFAGVWGSDSFWIHASHSVDPATLRWPLHKLKPHWSPGGENKGQGRVHLDTILSSAEQAAGWAWHSVDEEPTTEVIAELRSVRSQQQYAFRAWRAGRPDVARHFHSKALLASGFRIIWDVPAGRYDLTICQQFVDHYLSNEVSIEIGENFVRRSATLDLDPNR